MITYADISGMVAAGKADSLAEAYAKLSTAAYTPEMAKEGVYNIAKVVGTYFHLGASYKYLRFSDGSLGCVYTDCAWGYASFSEADDEDLSDADTVKSDAEAAAEGNADPECFGGVLIRSEDEGGKKYFRMPDSSICYRWDSCVGMFTIACD